MSKQKISVYAKFNDRRGEDDEHLILEEEQLDVAVEKVLGWFKQGLKIYEFSFLIEEDDV